MANNNSNNINNLSRRRFLFAGGATLSLGALISACGGAGSGDVARIGLAPDKSRLPDGSINDVVLLRTATSLEYNAIFVYEAAVAAGYLSGDAATLAKRFLADHQAHASATADLTRAAGGRAFTEPNPRLQSIYVEPALGLIAASADPTADVLALAYALETLAGSTYQMYTSMLLDKELRRAAMGIGQDEARHAATLGSVLNPDRLVSSHGASVAAEYREDGEPLPFYSSPSAFGTQAPVPVTLGPADEVGNRTTVNLETPFLNSMIYEYLDND